MFSVLVKEGTNELNIFEPPWLLHCGLLCTLSHLRKILNNVVVNKVKAACLCAIWLLYSRVVSRGRVITNVSLLR